MIKPQQKKKTMKIRKKYKQGQKEKGKNQLTFKIMYYLHTYNEAMKSAESKDWEKVIKSEKKLLESNNTWEILGLDKTKGKKMLSNKWVFEKDKGIKKARRVV